MGFLSLSLTSIEQRSIPAATWCTALVWSMGSRADVARALRARPLSSTASTCRPLRMTHANARRELQTASREVDGPETARRIRRDRSLSGAWAAVARAYAATDST